MRGRAIPLSIHRRMVIDLLYFARGIPTVPVQKRMSLAPLVAARAACRERPRWTAIFTKAYSLLAQEFPELRRAYVKIPWPHLYEYPVSKATIMLEREYLGERAVWSFSIKDPARQSLRDIERQLQQAATAPIEEIKEFGRALQFAQTPAPAAPCAVVARPEYWPTAWKLLRYLRAVGLLCTERRIVASAITDDDAAELWRHEQ